MEFEIHGFLSCFIFELEAFLVGACLSVICCSLLITEDILSWTFVLMRDIKSTVSKSSMNFYFLKVVKSL